MTASPTEQAITNAVTKRDNSPAGLVKQYGSDFKQVMPTHIKGDAWIRIAVGALKKGKRNANGLTDLEIAAGNNPAVFMASLLDAARLGLEPGTEQYYLTPRTRDGKLDILGMVGYQGIIVLLYRAGAVASVVAEVVHANDRFSYQPGRDQVPTHEIDWDSDDRGQLRLVYAYARMKDGAVSKVVILNAADIARIKASSQGADSEYSPWQKHPAAMWLKSAVRQLAKWVPTSAEYVLLDRPIQQIPSSAEPVHDGPQLPQGQTVDRSTGEILDSELTHDEDEPVDAELVDEAGWPETAQVPS
jgi:recombination protein RecT